MSPNTAWAIYLKMSKNIILNSLKESFSLIWKNKSLFVLLFILQIIFFAFLININLKYQTKILENSVAIADYISKLKLDDASIASAILEKKNIAGDDPSSVSRNYSEIVRSFNLYIFFSFILLIIFISTSWAITNKLIHKGSFRQAIKNLYQIFILSFFYLGLIFLFFYSLFNISIKDLAGDSSKIFAKYTTFLIFSAILIYFMYVSLSLSRKTELKNIVQKTLEIGIKKVHYILAIYFINIFLFIILAFLFYYLIEKNFLVLLLSIMLMILSFVFGRIFMVNVIDKLERN